MWYREGTITFTQGSDALSGTGTYWNVTANGVLPGMIVIGPDNKLYEIERVISDASLILAEPYTGETQTEVPCRIITTYEGDLTQFSARFTALMTRMSADSKTMRSWLTAVDEITLEREDGTEVTVKSLTQIVDEHNANRKWYTDNADVINAAGDKAREAATSAAAAADSAATATEKANVASEQATASEAYATVAKTSEANAKSAQTAAERSATAAVNSAGEAAAFATTAIEAMAVAEAKVKEAADSAARASTKATEATDASAKAKTSELNAKKSEAKAYEYAQNAQASVISVKWKGTSAELDIATDAPKWVKVSTARMPQSTSTVYIEVIGGAGYEAGQPGLAAMADIVLRTAADDPKSVNVVAYRTMDSAVLSVATVNTADDYDIYIKAGAGSQKLIANLQSAGAVVETLEVIDAVDTLPEGAIEGTIYHRVISNQDGAITGSLVGNASTATILQTARQIGGVSFDGSANINLPGVNIQGDQNTTGNAATATKLRTPRTINSVTFDGSANITIPTLVSRGRITALEGNAQGAMPGIQMYEAYNNGYPTAYGNILHMKGAGAKGEGEILIGWSGTDGAHAPVCVRSRRDTSTANWSDWAQVYTTAHKPTAKDVGALPIGGGTLSGAITLSMAAPSVQLRGQGTDTRQYLMAYRTDGATSWYVGKANNGSDNAMLWNYTGSNGIELAADGNVRINAKGKQFTFANNGNLGLIASLDQSSVPQGTYHQVALNTGTVGGKSYLRKFRGGNTNTIWHETVQGGFLRWATGNTDAQEELSISTGYGVRARGEITSLSANGLRVAYGNYGFFIRNDGSTTYFLLTASGDKFGSWNTLRPMHINNASGAITMGNGLTLGGGLNVTSGNIRIPTSSTSWIDMRAGVALSNSSAVSTSSASAIVRQEHADRHFILGGLGNSQFGIYMINKSRTANGTDAAAYLQNDGTWVCAGNGSFNDVYIRSDRRSKRNIRKIERALDKLEQIEGVLYEIQVCGRYEQSGGLIAQDVQNVQPELVTVDHNDQSGEPRLRLNYNGVIGMLVEAVKELREEVRELKAKM